MNQHHEDKAPSRPTQTITIIIEGERHVVAGASVTYEQVVSLRYDGKPPTGANVVITVTYAKGVHNASGSLLPGASVDIKPQMVFNVADATQS